MCRCAVEDDGDTTLIGFPISSIVYHTIAITVSGMNNYVLRHEYPISLNSSFWSEQYIPPL